MRRYKITYRGGKKEHYQLSPCVYTEWEGMLITSTRRNRSSAEKRDIRGIKAWAAKRQAKKSDILGLINREEILGLDFDHRIQNVLHLTLEEEEKQKGKERKTLCFWRFRPCPHVCGYFLKGRFSLRFAFNASTNVLKVGEMVSPFSQGWDKETFSFFNLCWST